MESDQPYTNYSLELNNSLASGFEYVRSANAQQQQQPSLSSHQNHDNNHNNHQQRHHDDEDPDAFYRSFAESQRISQPDIVSLSDDSMAAPPKRRQPNGSVTKSTPSSSNTPGRLANRSISGPAGSQFSTLNNAKSAPVLASASSSSSKARTGLIKERLRQFDSREANASEGASRYGRSRSPSGSNFSSAQMSGQEQRFAKNGNTASPRSRAGSGTQRRPLFGEVLDTNMVAEGGFGIPRVDEELYSPSLMELPNAVFQRSRSHSELEAALNLDVDPSKTPISNHKRSQSDVTESRSPTLSPSSGRTSPALLSPQSRIPIRSRRASDIAHSTASSRQRSSLTTSVTPSSSRNQTPKTKAPSPQPMTLSSRRYSPPKRLHEHGQHLTAVITSPPPKTSPPLRSTRNRQPVTQATTNASRSKVAERFKPANNETAAQSRPKPSIPGQIDIAARRAKLENNLQGGTPQPKTPRQDLKVIKKKQSGTIRPGGDRREDRGPSTRNSAESQTPSLPRLSLEVAEKQESNMYRQPVLDVDTEFEESPILPRDALETLPSAAYAPPARERAESQSKPDIQPPQTSSLLRHVMDIRQSDPSVVSVAARTQLPDDFLSEFDDGETIQILLGATPQLPQNGWQQDEQQGSSPEAFHTPREDGEDGEGSDVDVFDGRSSIYPDDSVSMVFQKKFIEDYMAKHPPPPVPALPGNVLCNGVQNGECQDHTLDSDARSQINRVLDQYQEGHVTPEMAHGFQRQVEALTPQMPRHGTWESHESTKTYLQLLLDIEDEASPTTPVQLSVNAAPVPQPSRPEPPTRDITDDTSEASGGIAIIYAPTYGRNSSESYDRSQIQHSHTTSNSTIRPAHTNDETGSQPSYLDDLVFRPAPPPKDVNIQGSSSVRSSKQSSEAPKLTDITIFGEGLGLSLHGSASSDNAPKSPRPPVPNHAPPPPPPSPRRRESMASFISLSHNEMPRSSSVQSKKKQELFSPGLPESPAPRGRGRRTEAVDSGYQKGPDSGKQSLDITVDASRSSSTGPAPVTVMDKREKDLNERRNRIKELVDTEHSFHQDMTILMDIYMATSSSVLGDEDRRILFGNLEQVRNFTTDFLDALKVAATSVHTIPRENRWNYKRGSFTTSGSNNTENSASKTDASMEERVTNDRKTVVGQVFCANLAQIEKVYGDWLKGHTAANKRLVELQKLPAVKFWLDECHDSAKDITAAWSLDSLIIKPAQRLLKYPLLLGDLLKTTPDDHPDYAELKQALEQMKAAANRINDLKRRAELVEEAMSKRKESDSKMKVGKLLNRRTEKLKAQVGLSNLADDQEYETVAQKFGGHFFQLQVVMRDVEKYLEDSQLYLDHFGSYVGATLGNIQTDQERHPEKESNWLRFATTLSEVAEVALPEHVKEVRRTVIEPIQLLWRLHVGPQKMMAKRKKRLVEYVRHKTMVEKGEKPDKKLEQDAELFKAVNETLKEELPKLYALTKKLVEACLLNFIELQAEWQYVWQRKLEPFVERKDDLLEMGITDFLCHVQLDFNADLMETEDRFNTFRICNGATLAEAQTFLSPTTTFTKDDDSSHKRPSQLSTKRTQSLTTEQSQASLSTPNLSSRMSDNMRRSPLVGSFPMPDGLYQPANVRGRTNSAMSSAGPTTPQSFSNWPGPSTYVPARPVTSYDQVTEPSPSVQSPQPSPGVPRLSLDAHSPRLETEPQFAFAEPAMPSMPGSFTPEERFSGMFHSALPMSDTPRASSPVTMDGDAKIIFLAASLFEFHIDGARKEAGYPYLTYQPGEIFDVIGQKGELWLAKNQDDSAKTIGWIWEKHFARILPEG